MSYPKISGAPPVLKTFFLAHTPFFQLFFKKNQNFFSIFFQKNTVKNQ